MSETVEVWRAGQQLTLTPSDFVAAGGQARVYARDGVAYKVFTSQPPPPDKLAALHRLATPGIIAPEQLLTDASGATIGFTMRHLEGWMPLVRLFPRSYRERHGLDVAAVGRLVLELRERVRHAHAHGALIVDLNELNVLVAPDHRSLALIDVDSWQIPGHPASAIAPSVQDHRSSAFDIGTDWYAFAVTSFQLFSGIHPFRGRQPGNPDLAARVKRGLSVFHPDTVVPPMAELRVPWRGWYQAVFASGERSAPPDQLTPPEAPWIPTSLPDDVRQTRCFALPSTLLGVASWSGRSWAWTADGLYEGRRRLTDAPEPGALPVRTSTGIGFLGAAELAAWPERSAHQGTVHVRLEEQLLQLIPTPWGLTTRLASTCAPRATRLYRGCAVSNVLGSTWITVLGDGTAVQQRRPELDGRIVVDAEHDSGLTVVITTASSGFERHLFGPDGHRSEPTDHPEAHVRVLPSGIALLQHPDRLELCRADAVLGPTRVLSVALPGLLEVLDGRPGYREGQSWMELSVNQR